MSESSIVGVEFADNPEPRCPCVLVLDVSGSMDGKPIRELNWGLQAYADELGKDALASKRVEVALVTFGPVQALLDFTLAADFIAPQLSATGDTPMGAAVERALDLLEVRKAEYRSAGVPFYRPWVFLITDGAPTDNWQGAAQRIRDGEAKKSFAFFAVGVQDADIPMLTQLSVRPPLKLGGLRFRDLFQWLSSSQRAVSQSAAGQAVKLPSTAGWTEVE